MSPQQHAHRPEYEKDDQAREIYHFYYNQAEDVPRPYPYGAYITDAEKIIRPQLDQPKRVAEILSGMAAILDNTADFDRRHESQRKAFDVLTAYQSATFSLFTPAGKSRETLHARAAQPQQPPAQ